MATASHSTRYRADIDGLRAVAVLSVVLYHAGLFLIPGGFTGVDIFFAISGYLIGGHIYSDLRNGSFSFLKFYQRRAKRILPASFVVVVLSLAVGLFFLSPEELRHFSAEAVATNVFASNLYFFRSGGYFAVEAATRPLLMTWSLGIEEQFYFLVPMLLLLVFRYAKRPLYWLFLLIVASFGWSIVQVRHNPSAAFYLLPSRAWELGAGVLLAIGSETIMGAKRKLVERRQFLGWLGFACILLPFAFLTDTSVFPGPTALCTVLGTVLVLAAEGSWINKHVLSIAPLNYIGRRSYSWYLWHWPMLAFAREIYGAALPVPSALLVVSVAFLLAILTYRFVEQPFRRSSRLPIPLLGRYAAITVALLAVCGTIWATRGLPWRFPQMAAQETSIETVNGKGEDECLVTDGDVAPNREPQCDETTRAGGSVALWGDSHAAAIAPVLREKAHMAGLNFVEAAKTACPPLTGVERWYSTNRAHAGECSLFNRATLQALLADPSVKVIVLAAYWPDPFHQPLTDGWLVRTGTRASRAPDAKGSDALFLEGLGSTVGILQRAGRRVVIVEDVPTFRLNPVWRMRTAGSSVRRFILRYWQPQLAVDPMFDAPWYPSEDEQVDALIRQLAVREDGVAVYDLKQSLCLLAERCRYREGPNTLYRDSQHLAPAGAAIALRGFTFAASPPPPLHR